MKTCDEAKQALLDKLYEGVPEDKKRFIQKRVDITYQIFDLMKAKGIQPGCLAEKAGISGNELMDVLYFRKSLTLETITKIETALNEDIIAVSMRGDTKERYIIELLSKTHSGSQEMVL